MKSFFIIHEGCTEGHYLRHLFSLMGIPSSSLKPQFHNYNGGGPINAFHKFKALIDDNANSHVDHYLIVMDNDVPGVEVARKQIFDYRPDGKEVSFITLEPCMEGFLIAHFEDDYMTNTYLKCLAKLILPASTKKCAQCLEHLCTNYLYGYEKNNCQVSFSENIKITEVQLAHRVTDSMKNIAIFMSKVI